MDSRRLKERGIQRLLGDILDELGSSFALDDMVKLIGVEVDGCFLLFGFTLFEIVIIFVFIR